MIILGSGTSFGVPQIGCDCAACSSDDPRDHRTRTAAVFEDDSGEQRLLIDTPPELRLQMVAQGVGELEAVLYTHDHADHVHGIDDLRALSVRRGDLPVYGPADVLDRISRRFHYIFDASIVPPRGTSKPHLVLQPLEPLKGVTVAGMEVLPLKFDHGVMDVFGYRIGDFAYLTDVKQVAPENIAAMRGVRVLVVNALFERPHPTHLSIPEAIELSRELKVERTYFTHLSHLYTHAQFLERLPEGIEPAYDGLRVAL